MIFFSCFTMRVKELEAHVANLTTQLATLATSVQEMIHEHQDQRRTNDTILQILQTLMITPPKQRLIPNPQGAIIQGKALRIYFPTFAGDDPESWVFQVEQYHELNGVNDGKENDKQIRENQRSLNRQRRQVLTRLVDRYDARNWSLISRYIPGLSGQSYRLRWCNQLSLSVEQRPFSPAEEYETILASHARKLREEPDGGDDDARSARTSTNLALLIQEDYIVELKGIEVALLLEEFERMVGVYGVVVVGCKCMGKCRDGPNVLVLNACDGIQISLEKIERTGFVGSSLRGI
ncbi:hypothetical protein HHK36_013611 [Tetracentron sinense]|uniref:Uncharacterized protein n=1 Tax=Tetracentron sinense TaxID=13715 RepID=A0A834Z2D9_TETSI|nr:hypothetical protein HHK36_013611 [Tetracentron sinense]